MIKFGPFLYYVFGGQMEKEDREGKKYIYTCKKKWRKTDNIKDKTKKSYNIEAKSRETRTCSLVCHNTLFSLLIQSWLFFAFFSLPNNLFYPLLMPVCQLCRPTVVLHMTPLVICGITVIHTTWLLFFLNLCYDRHSPNRGEEEGRGIWALLNAPSFSMSVLFSLYLSFRLLGFTRSFNSLLSLTCHHHLSILLEASICPFFFLLPQKYRTKRMMKAIMTRKTLIITERLPFTIAR